MLCNSFLAPPAGMWWEITSLAVTGGTTTIFVKMRVLWLNPIYDFGIFLFFSLISFGFFFGVCSVDGDYMFLWKTQFIDILKGFLIANIYFKSHKSEYMTKFYLQQKFKKLFNKYNFFFIFFVRKFWKIFFRKNILYWGNFFFQKIFFSCFL